MKMFNICVDIDGTLSMPDFWVEPVNAYYGTSLRYEDITEYELDKVLGVPKEEFIAFFDKYAASILSQSKIRPFVQSTITALAEKHQFHYVTARDQWLTDVTKEWLQRHQLPGNVYLLGSHHKVAKALELDCDIFVEDRYENAIELAEAGLEVYLMDCNYNRRPLIEGVTRVCDWEEIHQLITIKEQQHNYELQKAMS